MPSRYWDRKSWEEAENTGFKVDSLPIMRAFSDQLKQTGAEAQAVDRQREQALETSRQVVQQAGETQQAAQTARQLSAGIKAQAAIPDVADLPDVRTYTDRWSAPGQGAAAGGDS